MNEVRPLLATDVIIARMAEEGLPVCAIARALKMPSDEVRDTLQQALAAGAIVEYPREDWPPGVKRNSRGPVVDAFLDDETNLHHACSRYFKTTRQQSIVLALLLKRSEVTKEQLHQAIERHRPEAKDTTDIKLVDVLVCILRRKLKRFAQAWYDDETHPLIRTMWGTGYLMEPTDRTRAITELQEFVRAIHDPGVLVEAA